MNIGTGSFLWDDTKKDYVSLSYDILNVGELTSMVVDPSAGAISSFIGITRDNFQNKKVIHLSYEAYDEMALSEMLALCSKVRSKWPSVTKIAIQHKLGDCPVGDMSVVIVISSPHRVESLEACHFAIDELKKSIPIWKKEHYEEGSGSDAAWKKNPESPKPLLAPSTDAASDTSISGTVDLPNPPVVF